MNSVKETIRDYEYATAGRFYNVSQKKSIFQLVARANLLRKEDVASLSDTVFSPDVEEYKNETDCANGLLLMSVLRNDYYVKEILSRRKEVLQNIAGMKMWNSRESWFKFIHTQSNHFYSQFDKAISLYASGDLDKCKTMLAPLADNCHCLSVKLLATLNELAQNNQEEAKYLVLFKRIMENLYCESLSEEFAARIEQLLATVPDKVVESANGIKLKYFNEYLIGMSRIGF